jgi:hypothetical protein
MHKQSDRSVKLLYKGLGCVGFLLIIGVGYVYLTESEIVSIDRVLVTLGVFLIAVSYWLFWAKPKLQVGQGWAASIPLLLLMFVSIVAEAVEIVPSSFAWLIGNVATGLAIFIASFLLDAKDCSMYTDDE